MTDQRQRPRPRLSKTLVPSYRVDPRSLYRSQVFTPLPPLDYFYLQPRGPGKTVGFVDRPLTRVDNVASERKKKFALLISDALDAGAGAVTDAGCAGSRRPEGWMLGRLAASRSPGLCAPEGFGRWVVGDSSRVCAAGLVSGTLSEGGLAVGGLSGAGTRARRNNTHRHNAGTFAGGRASGWVGVCMHTSTPYARANLFLSI